jgi:NADH:ubiquinone oxidoreductase subunit 6 (subunit J)
MRMLNKHFTVMQILTAVYNFFRPRIAGMMVAILFLAIVLISIGFTNWNTVDQIPQNAMDQSNIQGIGMLIFTDFVIPFEILSIVLLSTLMGAIYMAKGDGTE